MHACTALKYGGRYLQVWFAALLHGLVVEGVSYMLPDIDSFWHGHSSVIFFKQRLPLHILLFCKFDMDVHGYAGKPPILTWSQRLVAIEYTLEWRDF